MKLVTLDVIITEVDGDLVKAKSLGEMFEFTLTSEDNEIPQECRVVGKRGKITFSLFDKLAPLVFQPEETNTVSLPSYEDIDSIEPIDPVSLLVQNYEPCGINKQTGEHYDQKFREELVKALNYAIVQGKLYKL